MHAVAGKFRQDRSGRHQRRDGGGGESRMPVCERRRGIALPRRARSDTAANDGTRARQCDDRESAKSPIRIKIGNVTALKTAQPMTGAAPIASDARQQMAGKRIAQQRPKRGRHRRAEDSIERRCHGKIRPRVASDLTLHCARCELHAAFNKASTFGHGSGARLRNGAQSVSVMRSKIVALTEGRARIRAHQSCDRRVAIPHIRRASEARAARCME